MCWQKFILFSLAQKGVFMTILRRTVLGIQWSVNKCFGWSEKSLIIIYGYVSNKNGLHFIQDIPICIVLTKIRFDHTGTEMAFWVHMIPIPWWTSEAWFSQLTHPVLIILGPWYGQSCNLWLRWQKIILIVYPCCTVPNVLTKIHFVNFDPKY